MRYLWTIFLTVFYVDQFQRFYIGRIVPQLLKLVGEICFAYLVYNILSLTKHQKRNLGFFIFGYATYGFIEYCYSEIFKFTFRMQQITLLKELFVIRNALHLNIFLRGLLLFLPLLVYLLLRASSFYDQETCNGSRMAIPVGLVFLLIINIFFGYASAYDIYLCGAYNAFYYDLRETAHTLITRMSVNSENLDDFNRRYSPQTTNELTGYFKDKNLVVVLCESLDESAIREDLTPTLYQIYQDSWVFKNYHGPLYEYHTVDSEFLVLTGQVPALNLGITNYLYYKNSFPSSLANLFREKGYHVNSYHNFLGNYYNRYRMHETLGFEKLTALEDLQLKIDGKVRGAYNHVDTMSDSILLDHIDAVTSPFFNFVITASMHGGYDYQDFPETLMVEGEDREFSIYLQKTVHFDRGLEKLLNDYKNANVLDNTVFVFVSDHCPYLMENEDNYNRTNSDDYIPFFIYAPGEEPRIIDKECSVEDVYPTLANLFGLDTSKYYKAGVDVFSDESSRILNFKKKDRPASEQSIQDEIEKYSQGILYKNYFAVEP